MQHSHMLIYQALSLLFKFIFNNCEVSFQKLYQRKQLTVYKVYSLLYTEESSGSTTGSTVLPCQVLHVVFERAEHHVTGCLYHRSTPDKYHSAHVTRHFRDKQSYQSTFPCVTYVLPQLTSYNAYHASHSGMVQNSKQ